MNKYVFFQLFLMGLNIFVYGLTGEVFYILTAIVCALFAFLTYKNNKGVSNG